MIIKILAFSIKIYIKDLFNDLDATIVLLSTIDIILNYSLGSSISKGKGVILAFRAFRLLRIFKLAKTWKTF
jgi:hypothetical protein